MFDSQCSTQVVSLFANFREAERMRLEADAVASNCFQDLVVGLMQDDMFLIATDDMEMEAIVQVGSYVSDEVSEQFDSMYEEYKQRSGEEIDFSLFLRWFITSPFASEDCPIEIGGDHFKAAVNLYAEMHPDDLGFIIDPPSEDNEDGGSFNITADFCNDLAV